MDWLWGIVIGFILGLVGGRAQSRWDRQSRVSKTAESLSGEISLNKEKIERALREVEEKQGRRKESYLVVPFLRDAFNGHIGDLGLLPADTRVAAQRFYARLYDLDLIVYEGYLRQTIFPLREIERRAAKMDDQQAWEWLYSRKQVLHGMFEQVAQDAIEAGNRALRDLEKLTPGPWWRRITGR